MKINETFVGIQGEGRYAGIPMTFIRTSGCTRKCKFCDTNHEEGIEISIEQLTQMALNSEYDLICWTGGEPLLQFKSIKEVIKTNRRTNILETNGDLISEENAYQISNLFKYICISPKDKKTAEKIKNFLDSRILHYAEADIKIVTDTDSVNVDLIPYATMLMPLSTGDEKKDKQIRKRVWKYCIDNKIRYSPRLHYEIWGKERGK